MTIDKLKSTFSSSLFTHSILWCLVIIIALLPNYENNKFGNIDFYTQWALGIMLFYGNYYYLVPKLLLQKETVLYLLITAVLMYLLIMVNIHYLTPEFDKEIPRELMEAARNGMANNPGFRRKPPIFFKLIPSLFYVFILAASTVIRTLAEFHINQQNKILAESNRNATELNYLRKQTNPHFLFNALNSIYSLAYKKSDLVPDAIVTLSEMMRYMLYETDNRTVFLEKEINYLKNYIELQKLRLNNIENIFINVHGETREKYIEPLLLISFVENAFKYGTDYKGVAYVKIKIIIESDHLDFFIENKKLDYSKDPDNSGIGMNNIQSRLNLLYPNTHELIISETETHYTANLKLKLDTVKKPIT